MNKALINLGDDLVHGRIVETFFGEDAKLLKCVGDIGVPYGLDDSNVNVIKVKWLVEVQPKTVFDKPFKTYRKFLRFYSYGDLDCSLPEERK